ncbi:hemin importer ATP-binding subunit [Nocardia farcinica]|nr:hemin importer ATP-binding subunit [Nocardia farcinica]
MRVDYQDVSVEIDGARIVESVTLSIEAGGFVGIVGPNGSGKSTCCAACTGRCRRRRAGSSSTVATSPRSA